VPNLVGDGLQFAQDAAQRAGFTNLASHDALGRGREQLLDRDWVVCDQSPAAGTEAPADTRIDFGAVKLDEACPPPGSAPTAVPTLGATMPDLTGRSLKIARQVFGGNVGLTITDATGTKRIPVVTTNWQVCSTSPAAGRPYRRGMPVKLTVVQFDERCP
jgi:beta-lactam-binding protein with PASTA domain